MTDKIDFKELVAIGRKQGKVLPVSEAFRLHPVEDEVHQGKAEYWIESGVKNEM